MHHTDADKHAEEHVSAEAATATLTLRGFIDIVSDDFH